MQFKVSPSAKWRVMSLLALGLMGVAVAAPAVWAQTSDAPAIEGQSTTEKAVDSADPGADPAHEAAHGEGHGAEASGPRPVFEPEHGTWFNLPARNIFASPEEKAHMAETEERVEKAQERAEKGESLTAAETAALEKSERITEEGAKSTEELSGEEQELALGAATLQAAQAEKKGATLTNEQKELLSVHYVAKYDFLLYTPLLWIILAVAFIGAARKATIRPSGKGHSLRNTLEAALEAFQDYLIGVMGNDLARKYTPLIASFFFTILVSNWLGLVPGMLSPSAQPAVPIAMAIVGFIAVHVIAIKESGLKTWFMHFVGEPIWLAPLNFPLHIVGELIKPLSLSLRLLCNVFGEEAVVATLAALAIAFLPAWLPIPFQIPMLLLGTFFGFLQALVFSTLLAIYLSIFLEHNDDHGHGQDGHAGAHTEHATELDGDEEIVGHPTALTVGA